MKLSENEGSVYYIPVAFTAGAGAKSATKSVGVSFVSSGVAMDG